jgi:hypothetical protein
MPRIIEPEPAEDVEVGNCPWLGRQAPLLEQQLPRYTRGRLQDLAALRENYRLGARRAAAGCDVCDDVGATQLPKITR